jgi:hypothetical protein
MKKNTTYIILAALLICLSITTLLGSGGAIIPPTGPKTFSVPTDPGNGDGNPYGVAFVPDGLPPGGPLRAGDVLVSNFNSNSGLQGTGTTIVQIKQSGGPASLFFGGTSPLGLTTALGVLKAGFVLVGNLPTTDGTCHTIGQTSLLIIDRKGKQVGTLTDNTLLDGPWDLTVNDVGNRAQVFVSNVLNGTVTRINLKTTHSGKIAVESMTRIASGYGFACNTAAVVVGPTGLAYDRSKDVLYVASTSDNEIFAVSRAGSAQGDQGTGSVIYKDDTHLHGPLALALAPNGHLITANGDAINPPDPSHNSEIVEFTPEGQFVGQFQIDPVVGSAFGLAVTVRNHNTLFAAVNDNTSVLDEWNVGED